MHSSYPDVNSASAALFERGRRVMPGGNSRLGVTMSPYPIYASTASGCRITDVDGVTRIDFVNNWSSLIHGHGNADVVAALQRQSTQLLAVGMPTEVEIELAELMCDRVPGVERIRFSNSGSEGVLMALRAARAYTGRDKVAKVEGAYHGNVDSIEVSVAPPRDQRGPDEEPSSVPATEGIARGVLDDTVVLPFNDVAATRRLLQMHGSTLAAVVIDPNVSRMGFLRATPAYLEMVREVTAELGIVLIFDEVFSFRLGYHGAQGVVGITPDLTAFGKVIGGGLPVGATGGSAEIMSVFDHTAGPVRVEHAGTYNANPMTMAAGLACMRQMTPAAFDRLAALGDRAREGLRKALANTGLTGAVYGEASLVSLVFNDQPFVNFRDLPLGRREFERVTALHRFMLNHGVQIIPMGLMVLSTAMTNDDVDEMVAVAEQGMSQIAAAA